MPGPHFTTIYSRVKRRIAEAKGIHIADVRAEQSITGDLRFNAAGISALADQLRNDFRPDGLTLTRAQMRAGCSDTVRDAAATIRRNFL